jgi:hypothetical protein
VREATWKEEEGKNKKNGTTPPGGSSGGSAGSKAGGDLGKEIVDNLVKELKKHEKEIHAAIVKIAAEIRGDKDKFGNAGAALGGEVSNGVRRGLGGSGQSARSAIGRIASEIGNLAKGFRAKGQDLGENTTSGLANGIGRNTGGVRRQMQSVANTVIKTIRQMLGIKSPSVVMTRIGKDVTDGLVKGIEQGTKDVSRASRNMVAPIGDEARKAARELGPLKKGIADAGSGAVASGRNLGQMRTGLTGLSAGARTAATGFRGMGVALKGAMAGSGVGLLLMLLAPLIQKVVEALQQTKLFQSAMKLLNKAMSGLTKACDKVTQWIAKNWPKLKKRLIDPVKQAIKTISDNFGKVVTGAKRVPAWLKKHWPDLLLLLVAPVGLAVKQIVKHWDSIWKGLKKVGNTIKDGFKKLAQKFNPLGSDMIMGFVRGIIDKAGAIKDAVKKHITDGLPGFVKKALGISYPSLVFMGLGANVGEGMAEGVKGSSRKVQDAMADMVKPPRLPASAGLSPALAGARLGGLPRGEAVPNVRVYIGDTELRDIVRVEVDRNNTDLARELYVAGGVR